MRAQTFVGVVAVWSMLDLLVTLALLTDGFTSSEPFILGHHSYLNTLLDLALFGFVRSALMLGTAAGLALNPEAGHSRVKCVELLWIGLGLTMASYVPLKLLLLDEDPTSLVGHPLTWALLAWTLKQKGRVGSLTTSSLSIWNYGPKSVGVEVAALGFLIVMAAAGRLRSLDKSLSKSGSGASDEEALVPSDGEKKSLKDTTGILRRLLRYCKAEWKLYLFGFVSLFFYSLARIFIPYYMAQVISTIVITKSYKDLQKSILVMMGLSLASAFFGGLRGGSFTYAIAGVSRQIRGELFASLTSQEIGFFDTTKTGDLTSRLTADCQTMSDTVGLNVNVFLRNFVLFIGSLIVMMKMSWQMTMVTFIVIPLIGLISKVYGAYYDRLSKETQDSLAKANEVADEVLGAMRTVRSFAAEKTEADRYWVRLDEVLRIKLKQTYAYVAYVWTNETFDLLILTAVLWYGGHLVISGRIDSQALIAFLLYQLQLGETLVTMGNVWTGLMQSVGASRKVFEYIDRKPAIAYDGVLAPRGTFSGSISFKDVRFSYPSRPDKTVLRDMTFDIKAGETVALVGPSGGGKSSTIALLQHFYEPDSGSILVDGLPVADYSHRFFHNRISLVGQEPVLFSCSIAENIAYGLGEGEAVMEKEEAARLANAASFIGEFTDKYQTKVGEKGAQLSGGQKQRVAIARSLVRGPKVLLLDEATSALDAESEALVQEAIYANLSGRTVLLIAHRLSTVERADRILVIDQGQVVQTGTHAELLTRDGLYRNLVQRQLLPDAAPRAPLSDRPKALALGKAPTDDIPVPSPSSASFHSASPLSQSPSNVTP